MIAVVAHPDSDLRREAAGLLEQGGWTVLEAADAGGALAACREGPADVLLADPDLGPVDAIKRDPELFRVAVVLIAGDLDTPTVLEALGRGAHDVLRTPLDPADTIARAMAAARTKALVEE